MIIEKHQAIDMFWYLVRTSADELQALGKSLASDGSAPAASLQDALEAFRSRSGGLLSSLTTLAGYVDSRLFVQAYQFGEPSHFELVVTCGGNPEGIDAALELLAAAPAALPEGVQVRAFRPPLVRHDQPACKFSLSDEVLLDLSDIKFLANPVSAQPGCYHVTCFVPPAAVLPAQEPADQPGSLVARMALDAGLGELVAMRQVAKFEVLVTAHPPAEALDALDLSEFIARAVFH